jgi:hypothetical protein
MISTKKWLEYVYSKVAAGDKRYTIVDREHIIDEETGVELHLYDDYFRFTGHDGELAEQSQVPEDSIDVMSNLKYLLRSEPPSPEWVAMKQEEATKAMQRLSDALEAKNPRYAKVGIVEDEDATDYQG